MPGKTLLLYGFGLALPTQLCTSHSCMPTKDKVHVQEISTKDLSIAPGISSKHEAKLALHITGRTDIVPIRVLPNKD